MGEGSSTNLFATKQRSDAGAPFFPAGTARAEDPGASAASEAAKAVPAESVRLERNDKAAEIFSTAFFISFYSLLDR
ncbi:hypothetical protein [Planococcus shixiaomingii]|uniref:hypothetical protein n=1 Tax=Planococcus shixiaomingii TaxID=3058393 RepID=UPI0026070D90|nr:hypothetical protein [Planococcus sp. N022]WKA56042.1 hypothetical protein QWY21_06660 [Planococcus sp. N022]